jgi:adenylate cyclase
MAEERVNRKLAAILAADVVGYSRLMGTDEAGTLAALKRHREAIFDPAVAAHKGRIVKLIGDGVIAEFGSVIDAVSCALSVQRSSATTPDQNASQPTIVLRIGINLGDVIIEGDDIYGEGVNIAARLEPVAEPGGICVSSIVNESVGNRIDVRFQDGGEISVKNIDRPIRVWKWHPSATIPTAARSHTARPGPNSGTASIAVLPFTNMSGDPEQEYFSDGISEDIITDLSKITGLMVIARNSSFTYKGRSVDVRTVGCDLGVRSVLEGSIRRAGKRVRITAQLTDAATGAHLWADRYDRDLTDIFEVQDDVVKKIVDALAVTLTQGERQRLRQHGTSNVEAYECWLRARAFLTRGTRESIMEARAMYRRAIEFDLNFAAPHAGLAFAAIADYTSGWALDSAQALLEAERWARRALELNDQEPVSHMALGNVHL